MELFYKIMQIILICFMAYIILKTLVQRRNDCKKVASNIDSNTDHTDDLKIAFYSYRNFLIDFGTEFNYCKFYFLKDEIYLFCRNTYPTDIYSNPMILKSKQNNDYSYFSKFITTGFLLKNNELKIEFKNKYIIGTKLKLDIVNISEKDKLTLLKNFKTNPNS